MKLLIFTEHRAQLRFCFCKQALINLLDQLTLLIFRLDRLLIFELSQ